tara:strand:+ start:112627 stop:112875 length:249 start_codon:yes stop_codon:yes gene_type:complete
MDSEEWEALGDLRDYQSNKFNSHDELICECNSLSLKDIQSFIDANQLSSNDLSQLEDSLGLGSGCSSCLKAKANWVIKLCFK